MEQSTLGFFIGIQNLCISHNKTITSLQWMSGNFFLLLSVGFSIWLSVKVLKDSSPKLLRRMMIVYWSVAALFFIGFNVISLSLPIDEREAIEEVLREKPQLAKKVRKELTTLQALGHELH
ncbi:MAG: hypothetical protein JXB48_11040 [Candidatus Latescibacteria bacterium]|nr:hypothetical protein [Candidatus Latescibacterota bacterium]